MADSVLCSDDILGIILRAAEGRDRHASLLRSLRLRSVSHSWASAVASLLSTAQSLELSGCLPVVLRRPPPAGLELESIIEVTWDPTCAQPMDFSRLEKLSVLSLRRSPLNDQALADALGTVRADLRLRSLSLSGCVHVHEAALSCVMRFGRSLTALDLSSCRAALRRPLQLEGIFCACAGRLQQLDLSGNEVSCAVLGSALLSLTRLTTFVLDRATLNGDTIAPTATSCLWSRLTKLRTLSLADNPELSAVAVARVVRALPSLTDLELSGLDAWPCEAEELLVALTTAPSLGCVGCLECEQWLTPAMVRRLQVAGVRVMHDPSRLGLQRQPAPAPVCVSTARHGARVEVSVASLVEDWEELDVGGGRLPAALSLPSLPPPPPPAAAVPVRVLDTAIDYSRASASAYRPRPRSIYHISQGDEPYYGEPGAEASGTCIQTDANGLRL